MELTMSNPLRTMLIVSSTILLGTFLISPSPAHAKAAPSLKKIGTSKAYDGGRATIKPRYVKRSGYEISATSIAAKKGKKTVARGKSIRLKAGTYRLTQTLKFRSLSWVNKSSTMSAKTVDVFSLGLDDPKMYGPSWNNSWYTCKVKSATTIVVDDWESEDLYKVSCNIPSLSTTAVTGSFRSYTGAHHAGEVLEYPNDINLDRQTVTKRVKKYGKTKTKTLRQKLRVKAINRSCLNLSEYKRIKLGMTKNRVQKIIGGSGYRISLATNYELREYLWCDAWAEYDYDSYYIGYQNGRVAYLAD